MKKLTIAVLLAALLLLTGCVNRTKIKNNIIAMYRENEALFAQAAASGDFSAIEALPGTESVFCDDDHVDVYCHGLGFGPSTSYFGIFYSPSDDMSAAYGKLPDGALQPEGTGWRYQQPESDNRYYVEPLGNHYFYYEESY